MSEERIISVGFLTQRDLDALGTGFARHFPVTNDDLFADLLEQLDRVEVEPLGKGMVIRPKTRS